MATPKVENETPQINRIAMRMPPFWPEEPELWFAQLESQFQISGITQEPTKYAYALSQLDTKYALEIKDVITNPDIDNRYTEMKRCLIQRLATSQEQRTKQLLEHEELGDRKPSQFLRHLKTLAGAAVPDSLIRTLWLGRLPAQTQVILATRKDDILEDVAEQADRIHEVNYRAVVAATSDQSKASTSKGNKTSLESQIEALTKQVAALTARFQKGRRPFERERSRSRPRKRRDSDSENKLCYYHRRFKEKARKCEKPCNFKSEENSEGSH